MGPKPKVFFLLFSHTFCPLLLFKSCFFVYYPQDAKTVVLTVFYPGRMGPKPKVLLLFFLLHFVRCFIYDLHLVFIINRQLANPIQPGRIGLKPKVIQNYFSPTFCHLGSSTFCYIRKISTGYEHNQCTIFLNIFIGIDRQSPSNECTPQEPFI